jgi:hypothetical protein
MVYCRETAAHQQSVPELLVQITIAGVKARQSSIFK